MGNHDKNALHKKHIDAVARKHETLKGKHALLDTWEPLDNMEGHGKGRDRMSGEEVHAYVLSLRHKARNAKTQLMAMRPVSERNRNNYDD